MSEPKRKDLEARAEQLGVAFTKRTTTPELSQLVKDAEIESTITVLDRNVPANAK